MARTPQDRSSTTRTPIPFLPNRVRSSTLRLSVSCTRIDSKIVPFDRQSCSRTCSQESSNRYWRRTNHSRPRQEIDLARLFFASYRFPPLPNSTIRTESQDVPYDSSTHYFDWTHHRSFPHFEIIIPQLESSIRSRFPPHLDLSSPPSRLGHDRFLFYQRSDHTRRRLQSVSRSSRKGRKFEECFTQQ